LHEPPADPNPEDQQAENLQTEPDSPDRDSVVKAQVETIFDIIINLKEAGALAKRQLNIDLIAATLYDSYEVDTAERAREITAANAGALLKLMDNAKTPSFDWSKRAVYRELRTAAKSSRRKHAAIAPLRRRTTGNSSGHESSNEGHQRDRRRRVRKSLLRPKLSSVSAKKAGKQTRSASESDMSDDSEPALEPQTPSKVRGHEFVREPPSASVKGSARSILSDTDSLSYRKTPLQETMQAVNIPSIVQENGIELPSSDHPQGDIWKCSIQGCGKTVCKASSKRSKDLIHDHSLAHAEDTRTKLDLVFAEQRLNINIGVDHLVSRIRQIGALEDVAMIAEAAPKRIRR
jgi:hypothetical protein